ncbi:MAG: hypothetical protein KIT14_15350 [bacterium]|nr:hypothetical protein [bacterium]
MSNFFWGALVGAITMYLYLQGVTPFVDAVRDVWTNASRPPAESRDR